MVVKIEDEDEEGWFDPIPDDEDKIFKKEEFDGIPSM
jgi:hypothetical protein